MNFKKLSYVFLALAFGAIVSCFTGGSANDITIFTIPNQIGDTVITNTSHTEGTIAIALPQDTVVTALVATFTTTGSSVAVGTTPQVSGTTANDFTSPVIYTVAAADDSTKAYTVRVIRSVVIGEAYQGGIVAYILQDGDTGYSADAQHGLIAATTDNDPAVEWITGVGTQSIMNNNTHIEIGTGLANTDAMRAQTNYSSIGNAASTCYDYSTGGGSDLHSWYLPSQEELNKLYINKDAIGGFLNNYYWSSSEKSASKAYYQNFFNGTQGDYDKDGYMGLPVRCVKSF